jgi:hypothetical protein
MAQFGNNDSPEGNEPPVLNDTLVQIQQILAIHENRNNQMEQQIGTLNQQLSTISEMLTRVLSIQSVPAQSQTVPHQPVQIQEQAPSAPAQQPSSHSSDSSPVESCQRNSLASETDFAVF